MAAGLPDLVDCARMAEDSAVVRREYDVGDLPRVKDLLAEPVGTLRARFAFAKLPAGRLGAEVAVDATPHLVCQRCMQGYAHAVHGGSAVEFAGPADAGASDAEREPFIMTAGRVSLRDLAEEELLLALPLAPMCDTPLTCGKAPGLAAGAAAAGAADVVAGIAEGDTTRRPFGGLQDLLKKTDRT